MITWLETVAPQTARSTSRTETIVAPFGFEISTVYRVLTTFQNWSKSETLSLATSSFLDTTYTQSRKTLSVLGTTTSTSAVSSGSAFKDLTLESYFTVKSVFETTTTQTTRPYTFNQVGSTTSQTTFYTTATTESGKTTATTQSAATTIFTTGSQSAQSTHIVTTTASGSVINTPMHATVVQAEAGEVIWVANTSAATDVSGVFAASAVATSTTKTTIHPVTHTVDAVAADPSSTFTVANNLSSGSIARKSPNWSQTMSSTVENYNALPNKTVEVEFRTPVILVNATAQYTAQNAQTLTITGQAETQALIATRPTTISGFTAGSSYEQSVQTTMTMTKHRQKETVEVFTTSTEGTPGNATTYFTNGTTSISYTTANKGTTGVTNGQTVFSTIKQSVQMFLQSANNSWIEAYHGARGSNGEIAVGYSCSVNFGNIQNLAALQSRDVYAMFPRQTTNDSNNFELSFSGLSVTYKHTSATETSSLVVSTFGTPQRNFKFGQNVSLLSGIRPDGLGESETAYRTIQRGAYWNGSTTLSFAAVASSYTNGQSVGWLEPISGISAATATATNGGNTPNQIWWTTSRNSHQSNSVLTQAAAYSAF